MARPSLRGPTAALARPFFVSTFLITLIATYALFIRGPVAKHDYGGSHLLSRMAAAKDEEECRNVRHATDQCAFVTANCADDEAGLLQYLTFYYCSLGSARPAAFIILVVWLGLLFSTIGIAASDFFSVNLSTIATILGLSESLAGVTFLAFGNGSPDVFSTFAAMSSNSGSMAVGELIGAAGFITAVVAGSMALVREFKVSRRPFVRDIGFFIAAVSFAMVFLADGQLQLWECLVMIGFYVIYVLVVVIWHWWATRRSRRKKREAASRGHFYAPSTPETDELEPYHDDEDENEDDTAPMGQGSRSAPEIADLSLLERGPRIEVGDLESPPADDEDEDRQVAAEMTSSMRVTRARSGRSNTTITPIRPSLVGALEFRSVLSSLQKARNMHLRPILTRSYTDHHEPGPRPKSPLSLGGTHSADPAGTPNLLAPVAQRDRALSSGNIPLNLENADIPHLQRAASPDITGDDAAPPSSVVHAPEPPTSGSVDFANPFEGQATRTPLLPQLQIPPTNTYPSNRSSPLLSPFPAFAESPLPMTPNPNGQTPSSSFALPDPIVRHRPSIADLDEREEDPKPVRWWPYRILPPPHILLGTLFPTLQGWTDKSILDKFVSIISVPSIFLLVTTLPVVESERNENDDEEDAIVDPPSFGEPGNTAAPVAVEHDASIEPETEWQQYRRRTRSSVSRSPALIAVDSPGQVTPRARSPQTTSSTPHPVKPASSIGDSHEATPGDEPDGWNRWLVALQLVTGPQFVSFVVWANMDWDNPGKWYLRLMLYSFLASLVLLAILLFTTSASKKPKYHFLLCFLGFIISVAWISTVAGEVVGVLKAFGVILGISEAILGLTIFAVGNSLGDLVADVTVARLGYPMMALSACFGGPMLNILLGVGLGGAYMTYTMAHEKHAKHPNKPVRYKPYHIEVGGTLIISAITVLLTLVILLIVVPWNKWVMSRKIGWSLIGIWTVGTIINLIVELTGAWTDVS